MFNLFLKIFLLLSPIFLLPYNGLAQRFQWYQFGYFSQSIDLLQLQFFQYGIVLLFLVSLIENQKRLFKDKKSAILLLVFILGVFFHPNTITTFHNIFLGFLLYYMVVVYSKNTKMILKAIVFVSLLNSVFAVLQFFNIHPIYKPTNEIIGLMGYKTHLGIYQGIAVPLCYSIHPALAIIPLIGLILSKSCTAIVATAIGMAYLLRKKFMSMPVLMSGISLSLLLFIKLFYKLEWRIWVWVEALKDIWYKPFIGYGVKNFHHIRNINPQETYAINYHDPYSIYLQIFHALGIFGYLALCIFIINKFSKVRNDRSGLVASCLILVVFGFGYSFMDYPRLAGTAIVLFGLLTVKKEEVL